MVDKHREKFEEQLSALMDGELAEAELQPLLEAMENDPTLREQWSRHQQNRQQLFEQQTVAPVSSTFSQRVSEAVAASPTVLTPKPTVTTGQRINPWIPLGLAASLAVVTVLLMQPTLEGNVPNQLAKGVETEWVEVDGQWVERWVNPQSRSRSYLVRHDENRLRSQERASLVSTATKAFSNQQPVVTKRIVGWELGWLPSGFEQVDTLKHQITGFEGEVTHLVLSNGNSVFSVFIEKSSETGASRKQMNSGEGIVNLYSYDKLGHRITVLGEVPMAVVQQVAEAVEARSG